MEIVLKQIEDSRWSECLVFKLRVPRIEKQPVFEIPQSYTPCFREDGLPFFPPPFLSPFLSFFLSFSPLSFLCFCLTLGKLAEQVEKNERR